MRGRMGRVQSHKRVSVKQFSFGMNRHKLRVSVKQAIGQIRMPNPECRKKPEVRSQRRSPNQTINGRDAVPSVPFIFFATRETKNMRSHTLCPFAMSAPTCSNANTAEKIRDVGDNSPQTVAGPSLNTRFIARHRRSKKPSDRLTGRDAVLSVPFVFLAMCE